MAQTPKQRARYMRKYMRKRRKDAQEREADKARSRAYYDRNKADLLFRNALLRADAAGAILPWSDTPCLREVYAQAAVTGLNVDHKIPFRAPFIEIDGVRVRQVQGLHVVANTQLLTAEENIAKGNAFDPDQAADDLMDFLRREGLA